MRWGRGRVQRRELARRIFDPDPATRRETIYFLAWNEPLAWLTTNRWRNCVIRSAVFFTSVSKPHAWLVLGLTSISLCLP